MNYHKNNRTTAYNREIIEKRVFNENVRPTEVVNDFGTSARCPQMDQDLRRFCRSAARWIAKALELPCATVAAVLNRHRIG